MRILLLCKKVPFPLRDGESVAINNMVMSFIDLGYEVDLLSFNTTKHYTMISKHPKFSAMYNQLFTVPLDNKVDPWKAFLNLFSKQSYHIERFISEAFRQKLERILTISEYDIVQLESIFLAPYIDTIKKHTAAKIVLRTHNVETRIWRRLSNSASFFRHHYLRIQCNRLEKFESKSIGLVDYVIPMSKNDTEVLKDMGLQKNYSVIPISVDTTEYQASIKMISKKIGFIGSLDWLPNVEGLEWFIENVWNDLQNTDSDIQFRVAGRAPSESLVRLMERNKVIYQGEVKDAKDFITSNMILVVPLFSGSGLRVKILEAMALGIPVITTTIGAEGIHVVDDESILIADNPEQIISDIRSLLVDNELYQKISKKSRSVIVQSYGAKAIAQQFNTIYKSIV